jgi:outer membrane immunogenic protein
MEYLENLKMRMRLFALALCVSSGPVLAADLGARNNNVEYAPSAGSDLWRGAYIGVQGGWGSSNDALHAEGPWLGKDTVDFTSLGSGGLSGGSVVGYNFQAGRFVVGPFVEGNWLNKEASLSLSGDSFRLTRDTMWAAGGHFGLAVNNSTQIYALAAFSQETASVHLPSGVTIPDLKSDMSSNGYVAGIGYEAFFVKDFSFKLEGRYSKYEKQNIFEHVTKTLLNTVSIEPESYDVMLGFSYHPHFGADPIK